jgi:hypothetical protein
MKPTDGLFPLGWWGFGLRGYRPCNSTYCWFPYDSLPVLPHPDFQGDFNWLPPIEPHLIPIMERFWPLPDQQLLTVENLNKLTAATHEKGISLPKPFVAFMSNPEFQKRIPSCTACYFELYDRVMPCPVDEDNLVIRFMNDQQSVFTWYLYLTPGGEHCVIVSRSIFDFLIEYRREFTAQVRAEVLHDTFVCAPSFEEFLYRFWLENCIEFTLMERHRDLTVMEQHYLIHYSTRRGD